MSDLLVRYCEKCGRRLRRSHSYSKYSGAKFSSIIGQKYDKMQFARLFCPILWHPWPKMVLHYDGWARDYYNVY